jgi:hypothetical protein
MSDSATRPGAQRKADTLSKLRAQHADVWVASAHDSRPAHLVPLSLAWDGELVILALDPDAVTARNIVGSCRARLALGPTRDVVMIEAVLEGTVDVKDAPPAVADAYASQADWDPRLDDARLSYLLLRPQRIQAWREVDEIPGRTIMRDGGWLY